MIRIVFPDYLIIQERRSENDFLIFTRYLRSLGLSGQLRRFTITGRFAEQKLRRKLRQIHASQEVPVAGSAAPEIQFSEVVPVLRLQDLKIEHSHISYLPKEILDHVHAFSDLPVIRKHAAEGNSAVVLRDHLLPDQRGNIDLLIITDPADGVLPLDLKEFLDQDGSVRFLLPHVGQALIQLLPVLAFPDPQLSALRTDHGLDKAGIGDVLRDLHRSFLQRHDPLLRRPEAHLRGQLVLYGFIHHPCHGISDDIGHAKILQFFMVPVDEGCGIIIRGKEQILHFPGGILPLHGLQYLCVVLLIHDGKTGQIFTGLNDRRFIHLLGDIQHFHRISRLAQRSDHSQRGRIVFT